MRALSEEAKRAADARLGAARIVHLGITAGGMIAFAVFFLVASQPPAGAGGRMAGDPLASTGGLLAPLFAAFGLMQGLLFAVVPRIVAGRQLEALARTGTPASATEVSRVWWLQSLIGWALIDAGVLGNSVAFLLAGSELSLAVTLVLLAFLTLLHPRRAAVRRWVAEGLEHVEALPGPRSEAP
ncbi:MAG: hypothetical protein D6729_07605 [Deltaproteobacteria bacterium]|nr:MAG: hypothetical protein D6729_07605 [Deltaproteobacteria bacterium]